MANEATSGGRTGRRHSVLEEAKHSSQRPLWDIEVCTPVQMAKQPRLQTPVRISLPRIRKPGDMATPPSPDQAVTPYYVGPVRNTFRTPQQRSPMTPRVSQRVLETLELVMMEDPGEPVSPVSPHSESSCDSEATTVSCSTAGSRCVTP